MDAGPAVIAAWLCPAVLALLLAHTVVNLRWLRRPARPDTVDTPVSVLLPVRDEIHRVRPALRALLNQRGVSRLEIIVLDDGSRDGTAEAVLREAGDDQRLRLVAGEPPPPGWLGKPWACHQAAAASTGDVLVFVDADVILEPDALATAMSTLDGFDLLSAYPRLVAGTLPERLIQPLLPWSWLTFLPLRAMERSPRPSLAAAGGQFLLMPRAGYEKTGHAAVRASVLEDVELARAVKRAGGRISLADFSRLAACRMYDSWPAVRDGYAKSLWAGVSPAVMVFLLLGYALPALGAIVAAGLSVAGTRAWTAAAALALGYALGVAGRVVTARATGGRAWPDALAQPVSIGLLAYLVARSRLLHRRGGLSWKGRTVP